MSSAKTPTILTEFVQSLTLGLNAQGDKSPVWLKQRQSLALATTLLRRNEVKALYPQVQQVVVVGPTQVGKSTVINHLTGENSAGVNALAGYTRHPQGFFTFALESAALGRKMFPEWKLTSKTELDANNNKQYSIDELQENLLQQQQIIFWDTPDFDSVSSRSYRSTVPAISGFADLLVLVVSKEKYADQSVWDFLEMIAPLNMPSSAADMQSEIETRLVDINCKCLATVSLPWQAPDASESNEHIGSLRSLLSNKLAVIDENSTLDIAAYFKQHWPVWLKTVKAEHQAAEDWQEHINAAMSELQDYYQRHYLNQHQYSEALQRSITKLLELLEIPILAGTLGSLRKVITWPVRTIGGAIFNPPATGKKTSQSNESVILSEALSNTMLNLQADAQHSASSGKAGESVWWQALHNELQSQRSHIEEQAGKLIDDLQPNFEPEIEAAANRLYKSLQDQPATLNGLRAARVTTDAAAVVLALHTGGLSATDLVLAPALLSVTSLLAESAVGQHMKVIEKELKEKQAKQVDEVLVNGALRTSLLQLPQLLRHENLYNVTPEQLAEAERSLGSLT